MAIDLYIHELHQDDDGLFWHSIEFVDDRWLTIAFRGFDYRDVVINQDADDAP